VQVLAPLVADQADLVLGARQFGCDHPLHAALGTRLVAAFVAWRYRVTLSDIGPYRAIRVPLLKRLGMRDRAFGWPVEMVVKAAASPRRISRGRSTAASSIGSRSLSGSSSTGSASRCSTATCRA